MTLHVRLVVFAVAFFFGAMLVLFLRRRQLRPEYALVWTGAIILMILLAAFPRLVNLLVAVTGMAYQSAVILFVFALAALMFMNVSLIACRHGRRIVRLTQELAILKAELESLRRPPPEA